MMIYSSLLYSTLLYSTMSNPALIFNKLQRFRFTFVAQSSHDHRTTIAQLSLNRRIIKQRPPIKSGTKTDSIGGCSKAFSSVGFYSHTK